MWRTAYRLLLRTGVFLLLLVVGVRSLFVPSVSIEEGVDVALRYGWSVLWIVGPLLCAWGLARMDDRWQIAGYPAVIGGGLIYSAVLIDRGENSLYIGLVVLAFVWQQTSRLVQLWQLRFGGDVDGMAGRAGGLDRRRSSHLLGVLRGPRRRLAARAEEAPQRPQA